MFSEELRKILQKVYNDAIVAVEIMRLPGQASKVNRKKSIDQTLTAITELVKGIVLNDEEELEKVILSISGNECFAALHKRIIRVFCTEILKRLEE